MSASVRFGSGKNPTLCAIAAGGTIVVVRQNESHRDYRVNESITDGSAVRHVVD
jgi:hypothetical protein